MNGLEMLCCRPLTGVSSRLPRAPRWGVRWSAVLLLAAAPLGVAAQARAQAAGQDGSSVRRVLRGINASAAENGERAVPFRLLRPLRTFRGRAVQVGSQGRRELSIGVVRAIRADGSKSIGVVRPIRNTFEPTPPLNPGRVVASGPAAGSKPAVAGPGPDSYPAVLVPGIDSGGRGTASLQIFAGQPRPVDEGANAWDLLNAGRYHAAAERFNPSGDVAERTGAALASMLAGDLAAAAATLPDEPVLAQGVNLERPTVMRLRQMAAVFFAHDPATREALTGLLAGR